MCGKKTGWGGERAASGGLFESGPSVGWCGVVWGGVGWISGFQGGGVSPAGVYADLARPAGVSLHDSPSLTPDWFTPDWFTYMILSMRPRWAAHPGTHPHNLSKETFEF